MAHELRSEHRTSLRVETPCEFSAVRAGVTQIRAWLGELGLPEADLGAWELALMEAGNNAVKYAAPSACGLPLVFEISAGASDIEARVTDHTAGFDLPAEIALPEPDAEGGRGLYLMKSLTEEMSYFRNSGKNVLVLRRKRPEGSRLLPDLGELQRRLADTETALTEMTAELAANYESLVAVFRYSSELGATTDLQKFSQRLLRDLIQIAEADSAVLRLVSADGRNLETLLAFPETKNGSFAPVALADKNANSAEARAARTRMDIWFGPEEPLDNNDPLRAAMPVGNGICHAFFVANQLVGTATLARLSAKPFTAAQVNLLHTFVDFLAIQFVNARLLDERTAARVTRRELEIAADIQRSLLPARLPECRPFELAASCQNALQVGGDFYDVIPADGGGVLLVIADVMGKGVPAALFASVLRSAIRSMRQLFSQPGELLGAVNKILFPDLSRVNMFITAQLAYLDPRRGEITSASAGHCAPMFCGMDPGNVSPTMAGFPLGIELKGSYRQSVNALPPAAAVLLYTDGLTETRNAARQLLGEKHLRKLVEESVVQTKNADEATKYFLQRLAEFRGSAPLTDDQTLVLIRHFP